MDKYDTSQLTEFPRFEPESSNNGVSTFFNKFLKFPLFSGSEGGETLENKSVNDSKLTGEGLVGQNEQEFMDVKPEPGCYAVEFEARSLPNVLRRISSLVALGSRVRGGIGTRYQDTELAQYWMPDDISRECYECATRFSTLRRRHHCRVCGQIFCSRCCSQRVPGQIFGCAGGLRVCNYCCNVVLSYLRENDTASDISPDLRTLQENLQVKFPENKSTKTSKGGEYFTFAREQEERCEPRTSPKEALQDIYTQLSFSLPTQQHRYRLVKYNGVWRGCDVLQWIIDNTNNKTRVQASHICQNMLNAQYMECVTELSQFVDYALYRPVLTHAPTHEEPTDEPCNRLAESVSSYCLDLNLGESSARLIKNRKNVTEAQWSPSSDEEHPVPEQSEGYTESSNVCKAIAESGEEHLRLLMRHCLARESLSSAWAEILFQLCEQAAGIINLDVYSNDIDVRNYVQVKKVPGGNITDSHVVHGVVLTKNVVHRGMPRKILNPSVLLLDCSITYQRVEGKHVSLEPVLLQEREYLTRCAARLSALGAQVVVTSGRAARALHGALVSRGVALVGRLHAPALLRLARLLRAPLLSSLDARVGAPPLGACRQFRIDTYENKTLMVMEGCAEPNLGCCILLRGASLAELVRVKRVVKFMLLACYNWKLERSFLGDIEAVLPETEMTFADEKETLDGSKTEETVPAEAQIKSEIGAKVVQTDNKISESVEAEDVPTKTKNNSRKIDSTDLSCGVLIKDFSDPLRSNMSDDEVFLPKDDTNLKDDTQDERWCAEEAVVCMSPHMYIPPPYLDTQAGRRCALRQYFPNPLLSTTKHLRPHPHSQHHLDSQEVQDEGPSLKEVHPFIKEPIQKSADDSELRASLAHYRATGCRLTNSKHKHGCPFYNPSVVKEMPRKFEPKTVEKKDSIEPLDPLDPENHQRISLLFYSYSNKSANVPDFCVNPWIMTIEMYGSNDISLGAFLEKYCFNAESKCSSNNCQVPMNQHVHKFVHNDVCITVTCNTIGHSNVDKICDDQNSQVRFRSQCEVCGAIGASRGLSASALSVSLASYVRLRLAARRHSRPPCAHALHAHAHAFTCRLATARFRYTKISTYDIELPPEVIAVKYDTKEIRGRLINQLNELVQKGHETFSNLTESEAEKDYNVFKVHMEQIHLALTSTSLQEKTTQAAVIRSLWSVSDRIIIGEKMLRDAQDKWSSPPPKQIKPQNETGVEDKSDIDDSSLDLGTSENSELPSKDIEKDHASTEEDEEKGDKKTVRQILSQLLSNNQPSNQSGMIVSSGLIPVVVMAGEIGSVIAATLASVTYQKTLKLQRHSNHNEQEEGEVVNTKDKPEFDKSKQTKSNDHIEVLLKDGLVCRVYYAAQFHRLRHTFVASLNGLAPADNCACADSRDKADNKMLCDIEEGFIRSLAHCVPWAARGGKSGSTFCKTEDDRYVLKEMTKPEWQQFLEFAPHYFNYMITCHQNKQPSLLGRIVGVYSVCGEGNGVLVMENIWYGAASRAPRFDLKGSQRHRLAPLTSPLAVLMDENLLHMRWEQPLYVAWHTGCVLWSSIMRDTDFLSANGVMDYSLLLGIDDNKLVLGIIDYIRTFTWDKKLEHLVKKNLGSGQPTVVSPEQYKRRFSTACRKYFLQCPTHWDHFIATNTI